MEARGPKGAGTRERPELSRLALGSGGSFRVTGSDSRR